jgi:hypothetical protein
MSDKMTRKALENEFRQYAAGMLVDAVIESKLFDDMRKRFPANWLEILLSVSIQIEYPRVSKKLADKEASDWAAKKRSRMTAQNDSHQP